MPKLVQKKSGLRVGILSLNDPSKGLWRDTEALLWVLHGQPTRLNGKQAESVSVFIVKKFGNVIRNTPKDATACSSKKILPCSVKNGTRFVDWLHSLDVLICNEVWLEKAFRLACKCGVKVIYVPNIDWALTNGSTTRWINDVKRSQIEVWAKTEFVQRTLHKHGIDSTLIRWSIPDQVCRDRNVRRKKPVVFLFNAGRGGWKNRRGLDLALKAFVLARQQEPNIVLVIHSIKPLHKYVAKGLLEVEGLHISEGFVSRSILDKFYAESDVLLYPTRWDGFGLSLLEALHAGLPVIATDGYPMRDLIEHEHNGLLVKAKRVGKINLTSHFECSVNSLAEAITHLAQDEILRDRLTCPEPGVLIARQHSFCLRVRQRVFSEPQSRVIVFTRKKSVQNCRRSEEYWCNALEHYGYDAKLYIYDDLSDKLSSILRHNIDFVLVSKVPSDFIRKIRNNTSAPIILWHHDISNHSKLRWQWFRQIAPLCDLVAIPESGLSDLDNLQGNIVQIFPGAKVDGDRGNGYRPKRDLNSWHQNRVVFLGQPTTNREKLLSVLSQQFDVKAYGGCSKRTIQLKTYQPAVWGKEAVIIIRNSTLVLSTSMCNDYFYTSNRLFNSAGAGGCVLVQAFPGLEKLYPSDCVVVFKDAKDVLKKAVIVANDLQLQRKIRISAENYTWRNHTWVDRIGELLKRINLLPTKMYCSKSYRTEPGVAKRFWNDRAQELGIRSAGYFKWGEGEFNQFTEQLWSKLIIVLNRYLRSEDKKVIDFGCGAGRFSQRLADFGFDVFGIDISSEMLELARQHLCSTTCQFVMIEPYNTLPFRTGSFDILWSSTVLQHVPDAAFKTVVNELHRILIPDGLIILLENTHQYINRTSKSGHVIFRHPKEYVNAFPGVRTVNHIKIAGEMHTVFVGRLQNR